MNLLESLRWRHACKRMNGEKVPQEKVDRILEAISLTPTSLGLQAYKVIVVENDELKNEIYDKACQQMPVKECSHLLIFASYTQVTEKDLDEYFELIRKRRKELATDEWCKNYRERIRFFLDREYERMEEWLAQQAHIALGVACVAAADEQVDSVPIGGFDPKALNEILKLREQGLSSTVILPLGYSDAANDWNAKLPKVRKDATDFIEIIK
ncbi:nitroreductase family protein [Dysgonomonas massiliensis]|uniref:nitroreductase family protein n=1 Tax=Dysgonomonas massiliensis TaxID=2040292 RepID=UPI000C76D065|nr:nitroreductase family protein [Dysgonomonas massiliensis]